MENTLKANSISGRKRKKRGWMAGFARKRRKKAACKCVAGTLAAAEINQKCTIKAIRTNCEQMKDFLFTLGCYEGEEITVLSVISNQYVVVIKDARYSIDKCLASAIVI